MKTPVIKPGDIILGSTVHGRNYHKGSRINKIGTKGSQRFEQWLGKYKDVIVISPHPESHEKPETMLQR